MKRTLRRWFFFLMIAGALTASLAAQQARNDRWLHVVVEEKGDKGELVRVNLPLAVAEKVLPAIHQDKLQGGKLKLGETKINGVDVRALLEAIRTLDDGEFVTVQGAAENVRVAKAGGYLLIKADERKDSAEKVDIKIALPVVEALLSGEKDELDLVAAVRALGAEREAILVTVNDKNSSVRIWVDSRNTAE